MKLCTTTRAPILERRDPLIAPNLLKELFFHKNLTRDKKSLKKSVRLPLHKTLHGVVGLSQKPFDIFLEKLILASFRNAKIP